MPVFLETRVIIARRQSQKCPSKDEWMNKVTSVCTSLTCTAKMRCETRHTDEPENILSEIRRAQKDKHLDRGHRGHVGLREGTVTA
jgi:hypothetical protein